MTRLKALIIDNGSSYIQRIPSLLGGDLFDITTYDSISPKVDYDYYILSGGHYYPIMGHENKYAKEVELIKSTQKPILGICLGFQMIAYSFEASLKRLEIKKQGILDITLLEKSDPLFTGLNAISVYESHRWVVEKLGNDLLPLASSPDGIEIIKHKSKNIYGLQFHPEMFPDQTQGDEIFANFHKIVQNIYK